jgi:hypothetical protein
MTPKEATENIGRQFRIIGFGGLCGKFDTILAVDENGWIIGNFIEAPAEDCRLKQTQPEQLKKKNKNNYGTERT